MFRRRPGWALDDVFDRFRVKCDEARFRMPRKRSNRESIVKYLAIGFVVALASLTGCKKGGAVDPVGQLNAFKDQLCKCTDAACVAAVNGEMDKWTMETAKSNPSKPTGDDAQKIGAIMAEMQSCTAKVSSGAAPGAKPPAAATAMPPDAPEIQVNFGYAVKHGEELKGKAVVVDAISWGTSGLTSGGKQLALGEEPLTGMQVSQLVAKFEGANAAEADALPPKDSAVKLRCTMGEFAYNAYHLDGCKVVK
jgi:hypothetical protein